ncbi:MAG: hypothetical protein SFU56_14335 [Capsulimonadales bacterium]|nr:hypothetical protein [Capsulimonadales bacterium]
MRIVVAAAIPSLCLLSFGCGGGSIRNERPAPAPGKANYEGPGFGDDANGGIGYTNTDILVRPPDQNNGAKGIIDGTLTDSDPTGDGWRFDRYTFTSLRTGSHTVQVQSSDFDPVLAIFRVYPDGYWEYLGFDDDSDGNRNARFHLDADRNAVYVVTVTSYDKGETGRYSVLLEPGLTYATTRKRLDLDFARPHQRLSTP